MHKLYFALKIPQAHGLLLSNRGYYTFCSLNISEVYDMALFIHLPSQTGILSKQLLIN